MPSKILFIIVALTSIISAAENDQYLPGEDVSQTDLDVFKWHNIARTDPSKVADILQD